MNKDTIKSILRESFLPPVKETEAQGQPNGQTPPAKAGQQGTNKHGKDFETAYSEVKRKLEGTMLKASQVMAAAGLGDPNDATDRSLFSKKMRRETNDEGGKYLFNDDELSAIVKVLNNPAAYLNVKSVKK